MSQSSLFSSGLTLAPFVISSGLLPISWNATTSTESGINSKEGVRLSWKVHSVSSQEKDLKIVVFETIPVSQDHVQVDLVSSSDRKKKNFLDFELSCTQRNPIFSVNNTAVSLLHENHEMLDQLKTEVRREALRVKESQETVEIAILEILAPRVDARLASLKIS